MAHARDGAGGLRRAFYLLGAALVLVAPGYAGTARAADGAPPVPTRSQTLELKKGWNAV